MLDTTPGSESTSTIAMPRRRSRNGVRNIQLPTAMKLACTAVYDAQDPAARGGRSYARIDALREQVAAMDFITPRPLRYSWFAPILLAKHGFYEKILKKNYFATRDRIAVKDYARQIARGLAALDYDLVFSPASPASQPVAYLDIDKPIVIWTDSTFAGAVDFYPELMRHEMCAESFRDGIENERNALARARLVIYYSAWAARTALDHYKLDPNKVRVITPGPAFDPRLSLAEAKEVVAARPCDRCRLVFIGLQWDRKGGDLALEVARQLNASGLKTELTLVGCAPPDDRPLPASVHATGYLSRAIRDQAAKFDALMRQAHFLIGPSRAEALGTVFSEALSYAMPVLSTSVGGIASAVRDGIGGRLFPVTAGAAPYCAYVQDLFSNYRRYEELALSAFNDFSDRLTNHGVAARVVRTLEEVL